MRIYFLELICQIVNLFKTVIILFLWYLIWGCVTGRASLLLMNGFQRPIIQLVLFLNPHRKMRVWTLFQVAPSPHLSCPKLPVLSLSWRLNVYPSTPVPAVLWTLVSPLSLLSQPVLVAKDSFLRYTMPAPHTTQVLRPSAPRLAPCKMQTFWGPPVAVPAVPSFCTSWAPLQLIMEYLYDCWIWGKPINTGEIAVAASVQF